MSQLRWKSYWGSHFRGLCLYDDDGMSHAYVGPSEPPVGHPAREWGPPWFVGTVWNTPPGDTRNTWHRSLDEARVHVETYMTEHGHTVEMVVGRWELTP